MGRHQRRVRRVFRFGGRVDAAAAVGDDVAPSVFAGAPVRRQLRSAGQQQPEERGQEDQEYAGAGVGGGAGGRPGGRVEGGRG